MSNGYGDRSKLVLVLAFLKIFSKVGIVYCLGTLGVEHFEEIAVYPTVKEIEAILCFATFGKN